MSKSIPFGPGHPDYDNQLDLFDQCAIDQVAFWSQSDMWPKYRAGLLPCPSCNCKTSLEVIQIAICMSSKDPVTAPGNAHHFDSSCVVCAGKAKVSVRLMKIEGLWWNRAGRDVVIASSLEKARRKIEHCAPAPLYIEHDGQ